MSILIEETAPHKISEKNQKEAKKSLMKEK
jgi:hypothetical protein